MDVGGETMASRMLHYMVAKNVAEHGRVSDWNRFIIGSLIPDASSHSDNSYNIAHFGGELKDRSKKGIDWHLFIKKYEHEIMEDSLYQGYICHLIADAIWYKRIMDKYIRIYPKKDRKGYVEIGYGDFKKLNSILVKEYHLECPELVLPENYMEEADAKIAETVVSQFQEDFQCTKHYEKSELEIYPYEAVEQFITESVEVCSHELNALDGSSKFIDTSIYYTERRP